MKSRKKFQKNAKKMACDHNALKNIFERFFLLRYFFIFFAEKDLGKSSIN